MSIATAVQKKEEQALARTERKQPLTVAQSLKQAVRAQTDEFATVLPKGTDPDRFARLVLSAIKSTPRLMECYESDQGKVSIFIAAMQAAVMGLEPNTPTQDCWLLPRRNKGVWECRLEIGYRGYIRLATQNKQVIAAGVVRKGDIFHHGTRLTEDILIHEHPGDNGDAEITHAYAIVRRVIDGMVIANPKVMPWSEIEKRRAKSDAWTNAEKSFNGKPPSKDSPWHVWPAEMAMKTAIRAARSFMDLTPEVRDFFANDNSTFVLNEDGEIEAVSSEQSLEVVLPGKTVNGETGEILTTRSDQSAFDVLTAIMEEQGIVGEDRLTKVGEITGKKPKEWNATEISEADAKVVSDHLDGKLV